MKAIGTLAFVIGLALTLFAAIKFFTSPTAPELSEVAVTDYHPAYFIWVPLLGIALFGIGLVIILWQTLGKHGNTMEDL